MANHTATAVDYVPKAVNQDNIQYYTVKFDSTSPASAWINNDTLTIQLPNWKPGAQGFTLLGLQVYTGVVSPSYAVPPSPGINIGNAPGNRLLTYLAAAGFTFTFDELLGQLVVTNVSGGTVGGAGALSAFLELVFAVSL